MLTGVWPGQWAEVTVVLASSAGESVCGYSERRVAVTAGALQRLLGFQKVNFLYGSVDYTDPLVYLKEHATSGI